MIRPITIITLAFIIVGTSTTTALADPVERPSTDAGTIIAGSVTDQDWGRPVAVGDLDGDGYDDLIVAASESWGSVISQVDIIRGGPGAHARGYHDLQLNPPDQTILGAALDDNLGASIAAGDINCDDIDDLILCASTASYNSIESCGIAYIIYGGPNFFDLATRDLADTANWDIRILGPVAGGDMGGANLFGGLDAHGAAVGYLNDDNCGDLVLGVHLADGADTQAGRVYIRFGAALPSGYTFNLASGSGYNVRIDGNDEYDELGTCVYTADLTGDGLDELILGNEYASQGLFTSEGAVHIFRGQADWPTYFNLASTAADITLLGAREDDELGVAVAVGDFNNDGIHDLAAAAPGADAGDFNDQRGDGFVYGLLGSPVYQTGTHLLDFATADPDFLLIGEFEENLGDELSAGDFNADGFDDIAAVERFGGPATNGVVEVLFGRDFVPGETFTANESTDLRIVGAAQDRIGFSVSAADLNADGLDEVIFGTPFNNSYRGTVYAFTHASADPDYDQDHDLVDFLALQSCFTGPAGAIPTGTCALFDLDLDEDIDIDDFVAFGNLLAGPAD